MTNRRLPCVAVLTRLRAFEARVRLGEFSGHGLRMEREEDQRYIVDLRREGRLSSTSVEHLVWDIPHSTYAMVCGVDVAMLLPDDESDESDESGACLDCLAAAREQIIKIRERLDEPTDF